MRSGRGLDTLGRLSDIFNKGDNFCDLVCFPVHQSLLQGSILKRKICYKGIFTKRKEFAPRGSKFFPFRADPFSEGSKTVLTELSPLKVYQCT